MDCQTRLSRAPYSKMRKSELQNGPTRSPVTDSHSAREERGISKPHHHPFPPLSCKRQQPVAPASQDSDPELLSVTTTSSALFISLSGR